MSASIKKPGPDESALAAAWNAAPDPLAGAMYWSSTRQGGSAWRAALIGSVEPAAPRPEAKP